MAVSSQLAPDKTVRQIRMVLGGVAPIPWRVAEAETFLVGKKLDGPTIAATAELALKGATAMDENAYKITLTKTLVRRSLAKFSA